MSGDEMKYHKKTFFPSSPLAMKFNKFGPNELFFSSGNKLVLFDFIQNQKQFRINLRGKKIISVQQSKSDPNEFFIFDIENVFYKIQINSKKIVASFQLDKTKKYSNFCLLGKKIFFLSNDFFLTKLEISYNEKGEFFKLKEEYQIHNQNSQRLNDFDIKNDFLISFFNTTLLVHNMSTKTTNQIQFQKKITNAIFTNVSSPKVYSVCLGDVSGKIHFISDINDKNYIISTKHWHSHRINALLIDDNGEYLYSAGQEGVIVIWNLKTSAKNFIPRLSCNITHLQVSNNSEYLACYLSNDSIRIISLAKMRIINEISSISNSSNIQKFNLFGSSQFLTFPDPETGAIHFYNLGQNNFPFYLSIMNKNFLSKTEEEEQNFKKLKSLAIINDEENFMLTHEELFLDAEKRINYFKFWRVLEDNIEEICVGENPHLNEKIISIGGSKKLFISNGETSFKLWSLDKNKFKCVYEGRYQNKRLKGAVIENADKYKVYALFEGKLIEFVNKKIKKIYSFNEEEIEPEFFKTELKVRMFDKSNIFFFNTEKLYMFDVHRFELVWSEDLSKKSEKIHDIIFQEKEKEISVLIRKSENVLYLLKYEISGVSHILKESLIIEKKKIKFVEWYKKYLLVVNERNDIFLASRDSGKEKEMTKQEMDDNDIEIKLK